MESTDGNDWTRKFDRSKPYNGVTADPEESRWRAVRRDQDPFVFDPSIMADSVAYKTWPREIVDLLVKWATFFAAQSERPSWYSKHVSTRFTFAGKRYEVCPKHFYPDMDEALFESRQRDFENDLIALGATDIESFGMLD